MTSVASHRVREGTTIIRSAASNHMHTLTEAAPTDKNPWRAKMQPFFHLPPLGQSKGRRHTEAVVPQHRGREGEHRN